MELSPYVEQVQTQVAAAAGLGDEATRATADALVAAAEPAVRLAVLAAVSAAAAEITAALLDAPGAPVVSAALDGADLRIDVRPTAGAGGPAPAVAPPGLDEGDASARVSLRLPETLKAQVDAAARDQGLSANTWIVRAIAAALVAAGGRDAARGGRDRWTWGADRRLSGWING